MIQKEVINKFYCTECGYSWASKKELYLNTDPSCPKCMSSGKAYEKTENKDQYLAENTPADQACRDNC